MSVSQVTRAGLLLCWSVLFCIAYECRPAAAQPLSKGLGDLRVMTYNVYEGTDFLEVATAQTVEALLIAVGQTITQVRATHPPRRMEALAKQILAAQPALMSLQELDQWSTGPLVDPMTGTCGAVTLEFDLLQELLGALAAQGGHYRVAVQVQQFAFPPSGAIGNPTSSRALSRSRRRPVRSQCRMPGRPWTRPGTAKPSALSARICRRTMPPCANSKAPSYAPS